MLTVTSTFSGRTRDLSRLRGVSLVEALLALAVMAFGILGVIGLQVTLRNNGDVTRQRAEAVRFAQEELERWRGFTTLTTPPPTGHVVSFADLSSASATTLTSIGATNTTFTLKRTVNDNSVGRYKTLRVQVDWTDRNGDTQTVALTSALMGLLPELSGAVAVPSRSLSNTQHYGRHGSIPKSAVTQSDGTVTFAPPGAAAGLVWVFNSSTGQITSVCNPWPTTCTATDAALLSGYIRFALGTSSPTSSDAEFPTTPTPSTPTIDVVVNLTSFPTTPQSCFEQVNGASIAYFCAVALAPTLPPAWSGTSVLQGLSLAPTVATGNSSTQFRVCRYTSSASTTVNTDHPLAYNNVTGPLINQNFLVIRAGNGSTVFACPGDDAATTYINGNTAAHQPNL